MSDNTTTLSAPVRTGASVRTAPLDLQAGLGPSSAPSGARTGALDSAPRTVQRTALVGAPVHRTPEQSGAPAPGAQGAGAPQGETGPQSAPVRYTGLRLLMALVVLVGALAISVGAAYESFYAFRNLAIFFGWPPSHAWLPMPLVELFLVIGSFELALRILENGKTLGPRIMAYSALIITLAVNVGYHLLTLFLPTDASGRLVQSSELITVPWWQAAALGVFAAIVPGAQLAALHVFSGRLRRMVEGRRTAPRTAPVDAPSIAGLLHSALANRVAALVPAPAVRTAPVQASAPVSAPRTTPPATTPVLTRTAPVQGGAPAPVRTGAGDNVVEINEVSRTRMQETLQEIHRKFGQGHDSWDALRRGVSLHKLETQGGIGKRRAKPALEVAETVLPWATLVMPKETAEA